MRTSDELLREVYRRAGLRRSRQLRRKKLLLGIGCFALSFLLVVLLSGKTSMTVAANTESYGSLVFQGHGGLYVIIAVVFFLLGIPAGLGIEWLFRRRRLRRIKCCREKWMEAGETAATREKR